MSKNNTTRLRARIKRNTVQKANPIAEIGFSVTNSSVMEIEAKIEADIWIEEQRRTGVLNWGEIHRDIVSDLEDMHFTNPQLDNFPLPLRPGIFTPRFYGAAEPRPYANKTKRSKK